MNRIVKVTRRDFLRNTGVGAGALVLGCHVSTGGSLQAQNAPAGVPLNNFLTIQPNGSVVIVTHRSEMGQGIRSSLPAVLADELGADWNRVTLSQADADEHKYGVPNAFFDKFPKKPGGWPPGAPWKDIVHGNESQFTDSSRSMAAYFYPMLMMGATARLMLTGAAAQEWGIDPATCEAGVHEIRHPDGRSLGYGPLAPLAATQPVPPLPMVFAALKKPEAYRFITKQMPFDDVDDMVTGKAVYGADVDLPGMLTAVIVRSPVANAQVVSYDDTEALKVPGVKKVSRVLPEHPYPAGGVGLGFMPHAGVAVLAENTWAALQGARALEVQWSPSPYNDGYDSKAYRVQLEASTAQPGKPVRLEGDDVDAALATAHKVVEADYYVPHLAQAPMEPPVAVARFQDGRWEIWAPTQGAQKLQQFVGLAMLRPNPMTWAEWDLNPALREEIQDKVKVHVTLLGGGFGRKSKPDYALEAAFLATQNPGVPIRVQWTREDDIKFSYFNAVAHQHLKAGLDVEGKPKAWLQRSAFPSFFATLFPPPAPELPDEVKAAVVQLRAAAFNGGAYPFGSGIELGQGLQDMPFAVDNVRIENCPAHSHIRVGWMRSVANIYHAFASGSFADELAIAAGRDSKDYLLELIGDGRILSLPTTDDQDLPSERWYDNNLFPQTPSIGELAPGFPPMALIPGYPIDTRRLRTVVEKVALAADWDNRKRNLPPGRGLGIAAHRSFLSYMAVVVEASLNEVNELTIHEIWGAMDCGIPVNPDRIVVQIEGGIVYALSLALLGEITVKGGAVEQNNFDDYPVLRLYQTPKINPMIVTDWPPEYQGQPPPTGVGEVAVPPVAPAVCNAIFAAGGPRIRELPLYKFVEIL